MEKNMHTLSRHGVAGCPSGVARKVFTIASFPDCISPTKNRVRTSLGLEYQSPAVSNIVSSTGEMRALPVYRFSVLAKTHCPGIHDGKQKPRREGVIFEFAREKRPRRWTSRSLRSWSESLLRPLSFSDHISKTSARILKRCNSKL